MDIGQKTWENLNMDSNTKELDTERVIDNTPTGESNKLNYETLTTSESTRPTSQINSNEFSKEKEKLDIPRKKKPKISLVKLTIIIIIASLAVATYLSSQSKGLIKNGKENPQNEPENLIVIEEPKVENPYIKFESGQFKFSFEYNPMEQNMIQRGAFSTEPAFFMISGKENNPVELENEKDLQEGYLVKISVFEGIERDIQDLAQRKIEKFKLECPTQREIGNLYGTTINGISGVAFEVKNCDQDYIIRFVNFEGFVFEIAQIYRGDIGFKQQYKAKTDSIVWSINWRWQLQERPPTTTIRNEEFLIEIAHPWLNTTCCDITKPSLERLKKIAILTKLKEENVILAKEEPNDKLGVFAIKREGKGFELFINEQKQALIQEYKVVEGKNPSGLSENNVRVGTLEGIRLQNYAWWGTVIYVNHSQADAFLIIVIPNGISKDFEGVINTILANISFLENPKKN